MELQKYHELLKDKQNLKFRITFFFVFFLAAIFTTFIITSVLQVNTVVRYVCSQVAMPVVDRAMSFIDPGSFKRIAESLDPDDPYYREAQKQFYGIKEDTNVPYLYAMVPVNGSIFRYIIDGSDIPGGKDFSAIGEEENIGEWEQAPLEAIRTGQSQLGSIDQTPEYGATITAYKPIKDESGNVLGFVACDIGADGIINWIRTQVIWQVSIVVFLIAAGLVVYITVMRKLNQSFSALTEAE